MNRRTFINFSLTAAAISMIKAHGGISKGPPTTWSNDKPLIQSLQLLTSARLADMREFYENVIGLHVESLQNDKLIVWGGETPITFQYVNDNLSRPFYHFAFNIPENKIQLAFEWQRPKTPLVRPGENSIANFAHWNAHSIFFLDPAGNLVEYIARHDLKNAAPGGFSSKDILYVSEIGLIVTDTNLAGISLRNRFDIPAYRPATPGFWPIGDEHGLLLVIEQGKDWASHPGQVNRTDIFPTQVTIRSGKQSAWQLEEYPYIIQEK